MFFVTKGMNCVSAICNAFEDITTPLLGAMFSAVCTQFFLF
jgi:hypothetical protein